ncbi:MAG: hypothetical protein ABEJ28_05590 [Salinigranum sp.]
MTIARPLLLGRSPALARRYLAVAVGLFVATLGLLGLAWAVSRLGVSVPIGGAPLLWGVAVVGVGVPASHAYRNDGLLVSVALGVPVPLAFYLVLTAFDLVYPAEDVLWGVGTALQFGIPAGALGFLVGVAGRRLRKRLSYRIP